MSQSKLAIVGTNRLAAEWHELARDKGVSAVLSANGEGIDAATSIAIETTASKEEEKRRLLQRLDSTLGASSLILTSCLRWSTTTLGAWCTRPERVVGFASFCPLAQRQIIELAAGLNTEEASLKRAEESLRVLGKEFVRVKDAPGLIFPRILSLIINEAARSLDEGVATAEEIDIALRLGTNYPQGPLRWADQIGLDEVLAVIEGLQEETGDDRYRPASLLKKKVRAGQLGEPSGQGFYKY